MGEAEAKFKEGRELPSSMAPWLHGGYGRSKFLLSSPGGENPIESAQKGKGGGSSESSPEGVSRQEY